MYIYGTCVAYDLIPFVQWKSYEMLIHRPANVTSRGVEPSEVIRARLVIFEGGLRWN